MGEISAFINKTPQQLQNPLFLRLIQIDRGRLHCMPHFHQPHILFQYYQNLFQLYLLRQTPIIEKNFRRRQKLQMEKYWVYPLFH
jgi:hypothetical protein